MSSPPATIPTSAVVNTVVNMCLLAMNAYKMLFNPHAALTDPLYPIFVKYLGLPNFDVKTLITESGETKAILDTFTMQLTTVIAILCAHSAVLYAVMLYHRQWEYLYMTVVSKAVGVVGVGAMAWIVFPERASPPIALFVIWDSLCVLHLAYVLGTMSGSSKGLEKTESKVVSQTTRTEKS